MYLALFEQILSIVNRENDLNGDNIVEKIKERIEKIDPSTYAEWEKKNFDINYEFSKNNNYNKKELTLLHVAFIYNQENVVKALLAVDGINVNFQYQLNRTLLHLAIKEGDENIVKALLDKGADVDLRDERGSTPLHLAIRKGNEKIVKALLDKGADVNLKDEDKKAPLHLAIENENIVNALLDKGADVNLRDKSERTPLHLAAEKGKIEIVNAILGKNSSSINIPNEYGHTPLCVAARGHHKKIVRALLKAGADPLLGNRDNKTLDKALTEEAIMIAIILGVGIFVIASVVAAIIVTSAYFIGVSLSVGAIAVAAAVLTGLVAGGIIYEVYKPCDELKEAIAKEISKLSQNSAVDDSKPDCSLENPGTCLLASVKGFINKAKSFCVN